MMIARRKNKQGLTDVQLRILEVIESFWKNNGYAPSVRGIQEKANISSTSMVKYYLAQLEKLDLIERDERLSRTVRLKKPLDEILGLHPTAALESLKEMGRSIQDLVRIPILGPIFASTPVHVAASDFSYYDAESSVEVARSMLPEKEKCDELFALEVQGDSMIDAMVNDGDLVVMKKASEARNGEMVVVWLRNRDETTLKYFYKEGNRVRLQPANPTMKPIIIEDPSNVEIQGKVVMVIRQLDMVN